MAEHRDDVPAIDDWSRLLDGRRAVVTGGGDGIGGAICDLFAQHGAVVHVAEIDTQRARERVETIESAGGTAVGHVVDVTDASDVARLREEVLANGMPSVVVNNVGDYRPNVRFAESGPASWTAMYEMNFLHAVAVTHAFLGSMVELGEGVIVNVHSVEGMRGYPGDPIYASMKAALAHFTTSLAVGYGRHGIRCNAIGPDLTQTPQVDYTRATADLESPRVEELWEAWAPVGRMGWPVDQARVALFLASDLASFVTGQNIAVDGGTQAGGGWFWSPEADRFVNRPLGL